MAIDSDVIVIGGGLAGMMSALTAAEKGATVRLLSHKDSTLPSATGLIDVLGYLPTGDGPIVDPITAVTDLPAQHPYRILGSEAIKDGLATFDSSVSNYHGAHSTANALVMTPTGSVKPTARYPATMAPGLASDPQSTLLVGFERFLDFNAPLAAAQLDATDLGWSVRGKTIEFPGTIRPDAKPTRYAHALVDDPDTIATLAANLKEIHDGEERIGIPAIFGVDAAMQVHDALTEATDISIFEIPMSPPSLPGKRLAGQLERVVESAGVSMETGNPVIRAEGTDRIDHVIVEKHGAEIPYSAGQFILATGGLIGKGIQSSRDGVTEPIFGCPITYPEDRYDWFRDEVYGDHPFARFGVSIDACGRPLVGDEPVATNLRAAGAVIGGCDFAAEHAGSGISIASGYVAGREAARVST